jgi:hypothetical protein
MLAVVASRSGGIAGIAEWVGRRDATPQSKFVERPDQGGVVNRCSLLKDATYVAKGG